MPSIVYSTRTEAVAATVPAGTNVVELLGYFTAGDGGGGIYNRVGASPSHNGKFQDASGAWFSLAEITPNAKQFGARFDGVTLDHVAIQILVTMRHKRGLNL